jgi:hypothetical protein
MSKQISTYPDSDSPRSIPKRSEHTTNMLSQNQPIQIKKQNGEDSETTPKHQPWFSKHLTHSNHGILQVPAHITNQLIKTRHKTKDPNLSKNPNNPKKTFQTDHPLHINLICVNNPLF